MRHPVRIVRVSSLTCLSTGGAAAVGVSCGAAAASGLDGIGGTESIVTEGSPLCTDLGNRVKLTPSQQNRVTIHDVPNLLLTSKQKLHFSMRPRVTLYL